MTDWSVLVAVLAPGWAEGRDLDAAADKLMDLVEPLDGVVSADANGWDARVTVQAADNVAALSVALPLVLFRAKAAGMPDTEVVEVSITRQDLLCPHGPGPTSARTNPRHD